MTGLEARLSTRLGDFTLDFELSVPGHGVTGLFGASGSGKTTALRCIAGLERAHSGVVKLDGEVWQDDATNLFVPPHERGVGYVSQEADLFPHPPGTVTITLGVRAQPMAHNSIQHEQRGIPASCLAL